MSISQITRDSLQKLTSESTEIRLRTLNQIANKLEVALTLNERIDVKPVELCKQLIRWFGFAPIRAGLKVLLVLKQILQSPTYGPIIIKRMGAERLRKELKKIVMLLENSTKELEVMQQIMQLSSIEENINLESVETKLNQLQLPNERNVSAQAQTECNAEEYELAWSKPSASDFASMKVMADILVNQQATADEIQHAVQHLQLTMRDYPAEYMLQAPHIFGNLLIVFHQEHQSENTLCPVEMIASTLLEFLTILENCLDYRKNSLCFPFTAAVTNMNNVNSTTPCQLKIDKALHMVFHACISHLEHQTEHHSPPSPVVWQMILKTLRLYEKSKKTIDCLHLQKLVSIRTELCANFSKTDQYTRLRSHQMPVIFLLQDIAQNNALYQTLHAVELIEPILRDYSLKSLYRMRYGQARQMCKRDQAISEKYNILDIYEQSIRTAVGMLMNSSKNSCVEIINKSSNISMIVDKLQSKQLIDVIFKAIQDAAPFFVSNKELRSNGIHLIIHLLKVSFMPLNTYIYEKITSVFKRCIGYLMNGEHCTKEYTNADLLAAGIVGIPLNKDLLLHLVHNCYESTDGIIQNCCLNIFQLLLQSRSLFGVNWDIFVSMLIPVLPLINCLCSSKKLMDLTLELYDPDGKNLPFVALLQGNIGFLFHTNTERRSEALTRLLYTLNSMPDADKYMPNLLNISDTLPNDICLLTAPREYRHIFHDISPLRNDAVSSLNNLFQLLDSPDVEPLIRKTTLMQINVLCSNWHLTGELCSSGAYLLIFQALEYSLQNVSCVDYPDTAIPAISILNKVLLYDLVLRCELSETVNIYVLLLRALTMFHHDIQARQDATMCLFQLIFAHQLTATENGVDGPLILGNIHMPIDINLRPALKSNDDELDMSKIAAIFATAQEELQYWRFVISDAVVNGLINITQQSTTKIAELDIKSDLKLTHEDVRLIRATQAGVSLRRLVRASVNATDHRNLIQACCMLKHQLLLPRLQNTFPVDAETSQILSSMLNKYLQLQPNNINDLELYGHLLDVLSNCLDIPLSTVVVELIKLLFKDIRHAFITMITQQEQIPLDIFYKICNLLKRIIAEHRTVFDQTLPASECSSFFSNLFDLLMERCLQLFEMRDLQRVRCLLSALLALSACNLEMPDKLLFYYCRRFMQLSLALKSYSQTGSQWHRDCLQAILQLTHQMSHPRQHFRLTTGIIKYLSGLCAHIDVHVRILVWSILYIVSEATAIETENGQERTNSDCSGADLLLDVLSYLPGGFMACCISTMLDMEEIVCVRQLAGQLFANLCSQQKDMENIEKLLEQHGFVSAAAEALNTNVFILADEIPIGLDGSNSHITTCELLSSYTRICIKVSLRSPAFLNEICTHSFMFKLYEVLKHPLTSLTNIDAYIEMIAYICQLYCMCFENNFLFLQRTLCRDPVWLDSFCTIILKTVPATVEPSKIVKMFQLLMVLLKDPTSLEYLSTKLLDFRSEIMKLFQGTFTVGHLNTMLQRCLLSVLSLLCIKAQPQVDGDLSLKVLFLLDQSEIWPESARSADNKAENKENCNSNVKTKCRNKTEDREICNNDKENPAVPSISENISICLMRLFVHLYPTKMCKLLTAPSESQQQIVETFSLLLKVSPNAQETAHNLKLCEQIVNIFRAFFEEFATTSCTTYVKRHGEHKKMIVVKNIQLLFQFLLNWHASPTMLVNDDNLAIEYSCIIIQLWPWLAHSSQLKLTVLQVCAYLCERSLVMCRRFSSINNSSFAHSVLQLTIKLTMAETLKIKTSSSDSGALISAGVRILMNCCSCVEGRTVLYKAHVIDIYDSIYPFNSKATRLKSDIVNGWLTFWEVFSRYEEGAQAHHLNALCGAINRCKAETRLLSLQIMRNMTFVNSNRITLLTSNDFIYTVNEIISQPITAKSSVEEQLAVCVAVWKLISGGVKFVAMLRSTKLSKQLRILHDSLKSLIEEKNEKLDCGDILLEVLDNIFKAFDTS